ncbi:unnamed protein product [Owenia fusiformis]|uniref:Uncharacterized protein n=1 Tax=Owenia fusiformis TaxID=6347 RepID=A0A8S4NHV4_OWEFU|nr:unnamed protein product [Owenia fusiformis]
MTTTSNETESIFSRTNGNVIGGAITEHLTLDMTEYKITDDLHVYPNVTLTIVAGTKLIFDDYIGMIVQGKLIAEGSSTDQIVMNASIGWMGIRFSLSAERSTLRHIIFDNCGKQDVSQSPPGCIISDIGKHSMNHLIFKNCYSSYAIDLYHSDPVYTTDVHDVQSNKGVRIRSLDTRLTDSIFNDALEAVRIDPDVGYSARSQVYFLRQGSLYNCHQNWNPTEDLFISTSETIVLYKMSYRPCFSGRNVTITTLPNSRLSFQLINIFEYHGESVIRIHNDGSTTEITPNSLRTWVTSTNNELEFNFSGCSSAYYCRFIAIITSVERESITPFKQSPVIEIRNITSVNHRSYGMYIRNVMNNNNRINPWNYFGKHSMIHTVPFHARIVNSFFESPTRNSEYGIYIKIERYISKNGQPFQDSNLQIKDVIIDNSNYGIYVRKRGGRQGDMVLNVNKVQVSNAQYGMKFYHYDHDIDDKEFRNPNVHIENSSFSYCSLYGFYFYGDQAMFEINNNIFHDNDNILDIFGKEKNLTLCDNLIYDNRGGIRFGMTEHAYMNISSPTTKFFGNIIENNTATGNCFINIKGVQNIRFQNNVLNNPSVNQEICIKSRSNGMGNLLDFRENFWGTIESSAIEKRITHFADSSRYAKVEYMPYLDKQNGVLLSPVDCPFSFTPPTIGGILCSDTTLLQNERYTSEGDIIVPRGMILTVGPGTKILFSRGSRMLILGTLHAEGNYSDPVLFSSLSKWNGIYFSVTESQQRSILTNVMLGNVRSSGNIGSSPVVTIVGKPPRMTAINIDCTRNSYPSDGLVAFNISDRMKISHASIQNCDGSAIKLSHLGFPYRNILEQYHNIKDEIYGIPNMCDYNVKTFEVNGAIMAVFAYGDGYQYPNEMICAKTFTSINGKNLNFRTIHHSNLTSFLLQAYNGRNLIPSEEFLSERVPSVEVHTTNQVTFTMRLMMTREGNSNYAVEVYEVDHLFKEFPKQRVTIESSIITNNGDGVKAVLTGSSTPDIHIERSTFMSNYKSINIVSENSSITINHNQFKKNKWIANIQSESNNGNSKILLAYNNITQNTGQTLVYIKDKSENLTDSGNFYILDNDITNNADETLLNETTMPIIWIDDIDGTIKGNSFVNNRGSKLIWWKQRQEASLFTKNLVRNNIGEQPSDKITIIAQGVNTKYINNWLENPANAFEMTSVIGYPTVQAARNWWGSSMSTVDVAARLRSTNIDQSLPGFQIKPIAQSPKQILGCSTSYCPRYTGCVACSNQIGCGWCDTSQQCMPGGGDAPTLTTCPAWFYFNCLTTKERSVCSKEIQIMDCNGKQCDGENNPYYTQEKCNRCIDIENCFIENNPLSDCKVWNTTRCPDGLLNIDYTHTRFDKTVSKNGVVFLDPKVTPLLRCPTKTVDVIVVFDVVSLPRYNSMAIVSPQAGGIAHRIQSYKFSEYSSGTFTIMSGKPASLNDLVTYSDFNEPVELRPVNDILIDELETEDDLLDQLRDMRDAGSRVFFTDENMFRCLGERMDDSASFVIVIPNSADNKAYEIGDVLVGTPLGYIESVTSVVQDSKMRIAKTRLTQCTRQLMFNAGIITRNEYKPHLNCLSGEQNLYGGTVMPSYESQNVVEGSFIQGRGTQQFSAKVLDKYSNNQHNFYVMTNVVAVKNDSSVETEILKLSRRKRQTTTSYSEKIAVTMKKNIQIKPSKHKGHSGNYKLTVKYDAGVTLSQTVTSEKPLKSTLGVNLDGKFNYDLRNTIRWEHKNTYTREMSLFKKFKQVKKEVYLQIGSDLFVPAKLVMNSILKYSAKSQNAGGRDLRSSASNNVGVGVGFYKASGTSHFANVNLDIQKPVQEGPYLLDNKAGSIDVKSILQNTLTFTYPSGNTAQPEEQECPAEILGNQFCEDEGETVTDFKVSFNLPIHLDGIIDSCSDYCNQCGESQGFVDTASGIGEITGFVKASSFTNLDEHFKSDGNLITARQCFKTPSQCFVAPNTQCCKCQEDNGVIMNGKCICDTCPGGIMKEQIGGSGEPVCSCECTDGSVSQLLPDGRCDCPCTCADGSISNMDQNGTCSCGCMCNNCQHSVITQNGCHCPDDLCPTCDVNEEVIWRNCECSCVAKHPCGIAPGCVPGRRGESCDQPECGTCQDCSGNGFCTASLDSCSSSCQCGAQWRGACCEFRIPTAGGGDPHLQTLDGVRYDFHGIGEFWDCKSEANAFGIQTRMFGYRNASLIGGVAIKAGENIVTLVTHQPADESTLPVIRLNGEVVDVANQTVDYKISDDVHMVITNSNGSDDSVMLVTLQYNTGVMVSTYLRYSAKMKRQYLNLVLQLTAAFSGKTSGLCGLMDDDQSNDFTGADGKLYNTTSVIQFVESWRVGGSKENTSGLQGSWTWTSSNFHNLDILGPSYTDTTLYSPVYDIREFPDYQINASREICSSKKISDERLLEECIFDVLVTEDATFSTQEYLKSDCPGQCSGRGECINSTCQCTSGWEGDACDIGMCNDPCIHGNCSLGFCTCIAGWDGPTCNELANCSAVDNCTDMDHGHCVKHNVCKCQLGFTGTNCSEIAVCFKVNNCTNNGICVDHGVCKCDVGWMGNECDKPSCEILNYCNEHNQQGTCQGYDICSCDDGWRGTSCSKPVCSQVSDCSGHGVCHSPNVCRCDQGFYGESCKDTIDCPELDHCSGHGICVQDGSNKTCICDTGFTGAHCEDVDCSSLNNCSDHGVCTQPNICTCEDDYTGDGCSRWSCKWLLYCSGNGNCTEMNNCTCNAGWSGALCDIADCSLRNNCSNNGFCEAPNICTCSGTFDGMNCDTDIGPNNHVPVFTATYYTGVVPEESPIGTNIHFESKLNATDEDTGRNAKLNFRFSEPNGLFLIDRNTAEIKTAVEFDRETMANDTMIIEVIVEDSGSPSKSSSATITIQVTDINDNQPEVDDAPNKPIFVKLFNSTQVEFVTTIRATDPDSEENGRVNYYIHTTTDQDAKDLFTIDSSTGVVHVDPSSGKIQWKVYRLWVVAADNGPSTTLRSVHLVEVSLYGDFYIVYTNPPPVSTTTVTTPSLTTVDLTTLTSSLATTTTTNEVAITEIYRCDDGELVIGGVCTSSWLVIGVPAGVCFLLLLTAICIVIVVIRKRKGHKGKQVDGNRETGYDNPAMERDALYMTSLSSTGRENQFKNPSWKGSDRYISSRSNHRDTHVYRDLNSDRMDRLPSPYDHGDSAHVYQNLQQLGSSDLDVRTMSGQASVSNLSVKEDFKIPRPNVQKTPMYTFKR